MEPQGGEKNTKRGRNPSWLGTLLRPLDRGLRKLQQIEDYADTPDCIFRIQLISNDVQIRLSDGTVLSPDEPLIDLHFRNEHVPAMPPKGPTIAWARQMDDCVRTSLTELLRYVAPRRDLDDVQAVRINMSFVAPDRRDQIARVVGRYGFETFPAPPIKSLGGHLHRLGENILVSLLVLAVNPATFRLALLWRGRTRAYLSRGTLAELHGSHRTGRATVKQAVRSD